MRLKSFTADSMPEAMKAVREHFGPDAVILSSVPQGPNGAIRVTAALEDTPLEDFGPGAAGTPPAGVIDAVAGALAYHRLPNLLTDRILAAAAMMQATDAALALAGALDAELAFAPLAETSAGRFLMLGLPGSGKTSTAAKLTMQAKLGGRPATIITLDGGKAGGRDQVAAFARALDVPLVEAADPSALPACLDEVPDSHLVVIDTPGSNPYDAAALALLGEAVQAAAAEPVLILAAGGDPVEAAEAAEAFASAGTGRMVATKLDAARRLGGILSATCVGAWPLAAVGVAPQIASRLVAINPVSLARLLLPGATADSQSPATPPTRRAPQ